MCVKAIAYDVQVNWAEEFITVHKKTNFKTHIQLF